MSARIAHIYAPSHRAVCASMSNENELVTSLAQNRTDDLDAPFAHLRRSALHSLPQCTATVPAVYCIRPCSALPPQRTKRHSAAKHKQCSAMER